MIITDGGVYVIASRIGSWWGAGGGGTNVQVDGDSVPVHFRIPAEKFTRLMLVIRENNPDDLIAMIENEAFYIYESWTKWKLCLGKRISDAPEAGPKTDPNTKSWFGTKTDCKSEGVIKNMFFSEQEDPYTAVVVEDTATSTTDTYQTKEVLCIPTHLVGKTVITYYSHKKWPELVGFEPIIEKPLGDVLTKLT